MKKEIIDFFYEKLCIFYYLQTFFMKKRLHWPSYIRLKFTWNIQNKDYLLFLFLIKSKFPYENDMVNSFMRRKLIILSCPSKYLFILFEFIRKFQKDFMIWRIKEEWNIKQISKTFWLAMTSENSDWAFQQEHEL